MSRCKCCDADFDPRMNKITGEEEDLCSNCLIIARYAALDIDDENTDDIDLSLDYLDLLE